MNSQLTTASTTSTPSSISSTKSHGLTTTEIVIVISSVASGVLLILILVYFIIVCRPRRQKYHRPESTRSQDLESTPPGFASKSSKDDLYSISLKDGYRSPPPAFASKPTKDDLHSIFLKDGYRSPPFVGNYEGLPTHESHIVSLGGAQKIKIAPLKIPQKPINRSNGVRSNIRTGTRRSSNSSLEADDSASIYSEASAYFPEPSLPSVIPPPMPILPLRFNKSTPSTLPKNTESDVVVISRRQNEEEATSSPPSLSAPLPSLKLNEDEEAEDQTEIYNVAKLLHSRQAKLPKRSSLLSWRSSTVSHIERSGSIRSSVGEPESEPYRPRYYRLKQKKGTLDPYDSYLPNPYLSVLPAARS